MIELIDSVDVMRETKKDSWGISVNSQTPETVKCRIMYSLKTEELKTSEGKSIGVTAKVYFNELFPISYGDKLNFTDDFGKTYNLEVLEVKPIKDFSGEILFTKVVV